MRWKYREEVAQDLVRKLSESINVNPVLSAILVSRGIETFDQAKAFFRPSLEDLHDPFLMKDMDLAADRLVKAIDEGQKILVYIPLKQYLMI